MLNALVVGSLPIYLPWNQVPAVFGEPLTGVTITIAAPGVVTAPGYLPTAGDAVAFSTTGALPTGLTIGTRYFVVSPSTDTFQVSATLGGGSITTSGSQSGVHTLHILSAQNAGMQGVPYCLKPNNTALMIAFAAATLQGANDSGGGSGDPAGPGSFGTLLALAGAGLGTVVLANDWVQSSVGTSYLVGA